MMQWVTHPRPASAIWAAWAWATAAAYWTTTPAQLDPVTRLIPGEHIFLAWAATATLLTLGATLPTALGRWCRVIGLAVATWLLVAWATAYIYDAWTQQTRLWVSGKNYLFMAIAAMATSPIIGKYSAGNPHREE